MNSYRNNKKNKSLLLNQLKLNNKSLELLESSIPNNKDIEKYKSISSRNNNLNYFFLKNKFSLNSNFPQKKINIKLSKNNLKTNKEESKAINSNNPISNYKSLTERNNHIVKKSYHNTNSFKSRNINSHNSNDFLSNNSTKQNTRKYYTMNINKYKSILNKVLSRIKTSFKKKKHLLNNINLNIYNYNKTISPLKRKYPSQKNQRKSMPRIGFIGSIYNENNSQRSLSKLEYFENTLGNEFNCKELIKLENGKLKEKLKKYKLNIYHKTPIYKTNEKLNTLLIRDFNLDEKEQKTSFNKKYKIYRASVNKIKELRKKNLFHEPKFNELYEKEKLNLEKEIDEYNKKDITKKTIKNVLNQYYKLKTKNILAKKLELEKELIDLHTKFKRNIEREKYIKNEQNVNYGQLNQVIQTKLIYKEIYETDIDKKKKDFYDEHTVMLHKVRKWSVPAKVVKKVLKQKTINKYKTSIGTYFGTSS